MQKNFVGSYYRNLDAKGRLLLPPRFVDALADANPSAGRNTNFWLTCFYGRLSAYMPGEWQSVVEKLCSISFPSEKVANFKTRIIGLAHELQPDAHGRIRIPAVLMKEAGLNKNVVLVGMLDKFEIWDQERFETLGEEDVSDALAASGVKLSL